MPTGQLLNSEVKHLIAVLYIEHPDWTSRQIHAAVHRVFDRTRYPRESKDWPSLSAVQKTLTQAKRKAEELSSSVADSPWSLAALSFSEVPAEALPEVVRAWAHRLVAGNPLTIREARWMGRLHRLWSDTRLLLAASEYCAGHERAIELVNAYPTRGEDARWLWVIDYLSYLQQLGGLGSRWRAIPEALERQLWPTAGEFWSAYMGRKLTEEDNQSLTVSFAESLGASKGTPHVKQNALIRMLVQEMIADLAPNHEITEETIESWKEASDEYQPDQEGLTR